MKKTKQPFYHVSILRAAFEAAGYPVTGKAGRATLPGWTVDRKTKRGKKS